jgi:hypothetical protein
MNLLLLKNSYLIDLKTFFSSSMLLQLPTYTQPQVSLKYSSLQKLSIVQKQAMWNNLNVLFHRNAGLKLFLKEEDI